MILDLFRKDIGFDNIQGYDDIKNIVRRVLSSEENYNLLFCGPPASAKTLFLLGILQCRKGVYFDGSNTTNRILDVLEEERPKIICIDELDKMPRQFQNQLLNFMESGRVKVDQQRKQYDFEIKGAKVQRDQETRQAITEQI
jgi:replication-associated recombination protein RarA